MNLTRNQEGQSKDYRAYHTLALWNLEWRMQGQWAKAISLSLRSIHHGAMNHAYHSGPSHQSLWGLKQQRTGNFPSSHEERLVLDTIPLCGYPMNLSLQVWIYIPNEKREKQIQILAQETSYSEQKIPIQRAWLTQVHALELEICESIQKLIYWH